MNKFRIYIGGVGGVGKTTICRKLARTYHMKHFSGSRIMMKLCEVSSREALSCVPKKQKTIIEKTRYPRFIARNQKVIVDGHCELLPEQAKCFDRFIFLIAPAKIIKDRREQRGDGRRELDLRVILIEQKEHQLKMRQTEQKCGIKFMTVSNAGKIAATCALIGEILISAN